MVEQMAVEMAKRGHNVEVLTLAPLFNSLPRVEKLDGYILRRFPGLSPSKSYYVPTLSFIKALVKLQADIVHVHVVHSLVPFATYLAKKCKPQWKRLVLTPHLHDRGFSWHTNIIWFFYRPILKKVIKAADVIHSISPHEARLLKEKFNVNPVIIPHGISEDVLSYKWKPPSKFTVIYSGQLIKYKRVCLLIKAMSLLNKIDAEARLLVIGNGPEKAKLVEMARQLKVNSVFISPLCRKDYLKRLAESSVLCYLSESEAFGITVLEAIAIGLPVIVVEPWGNFFKQYSRAVVLSSHPSPEQVANALLSLKNKTFSTRDNIPTWNEVADKLVKLYQNIIK